jgi:hypothetical protein
MRPVVLFGCLAMMSQSLGAEDPFQGVGSITVPIEKMSWRKQAPDLPQRITMLWGNVRQAGGEMHVDRCMSKEPGVLFLFQYARADVILPK